MKVCVLGNCQIAALRPMLQAMHGDIDLRNLPAVHMMQEQHRADVEASAREADWIVAQLVSSDFPLDYVTTAYLRATYGDRLIVWPNLYFGGYAPEYNTMRSAAYRNFTGPLLDYHNDKILIGFFGDWSVERTVDFVKEASHFDEVSYAQAVASAFNALRQREGSTDVAISDFVEAHYGEQRLFHIMNHPTGVLLEELSARILKRMGVHNHLRFPASLVADLELLSAWHPENAFIRHTHRFAFPECRLYRGVRLAAVDTPLGVAPVGPKLYNDQTMVEAMFAFYRPHRQVLATHPRVLQLMDRYGRSA